VSEKSSISSGFYIQSCLSMLKCWNISQIEKKKLTFYKSKIIDSYRNCILTREGMVHLVKYRLKQCWNTINSFIRVSPNWLMINADYEGALLAIHSWKIASMDGDWTHKLWIFFKVRLANFFSWKPHCFFWLGITCSFFSNPGSKAAWRRRVWTLDWTRQDSNLDPKIPSLMPWPLIFIRC